MASKTPFLTTNVGNSKEIIEWSNGGELLPTIQMQNGLVMADITQSIKILEYIYNNENKRREMGENGFKAWKASFNWEKISKQYENLYKDLISRG